MERTTLKEIAEAVAREMATAHADPSGVYIRTPLTYVSGRAVVVRIDQAGDRFFVTDFGMGASEADMIGATAQYVRVGAEIAARAGIGFDLDTFFVAKVSRDQLVGAVGVVANCSKEAVDISALRLSEKRAVERETAFYERLTNIFGRQRVRRNHVVTGASSHKWTVGAVVLADDHQTIFDFVRPSPQSVFPAVAKFHDIARIKQAPKRFAVVRRISDLKEYSNLLSQAANVIECDWPDEKLRRAA